MSTIPEITAQLAMALDWTHNSSDFLQYLTFSGELIAQSVKTPDLWTQVQSSWSNFVESGQLWAMLIGLFLGYWFRYMSAG